MPFRGGEREAGLRARIEALLATLEKLGRCDCLHFMLYVLSRSTWHHILTSWHPFNIFCRNSELRQQQSGDLIDDLKRANGWELLSTSTLWKPQKGSKAAFALLACIQGPHRLPWQVPPTLPGSDSQAGAALCWASKSPRRSPTCEQQHWHGREQEYKSKQQSWRSALRYLSLDLILLGWRRAVILIKTHPVILK